MTRAGRGSTVRLRSSAALTLLAVIGAGGAIGAAARYGTTLAIPPRVDAYPLGTFLVNVVGAVILGAVVALPGRLAGRPRTDPAAIGTGFCGGLTTFSTMSLEIYQRSLCALDAGRGVRREPAWLAAPACAWAGFSLTRDGARRLAEAAGVGPGRRRRDSAR